MNEVDTPAKRQIEFDHSGKVIEAKVPNLETLLDLFGTGDKRLAMALLLQASAAVGSTNERWAQEGRQFMVAMIEDFAPRDATERLLAMQMAATHAGMMQASTKMNDAKHLEAHEAYARSFNRLARTFTAQVEALRRHRNGGQSKVTVEHVTVNAGGQAIVGNLEGGKESGQS
jgi:hypothetical protein